MLTNYLRPQFTREERATLEQAWLSPEVCTVLQNVAVDKKGQVVLAAGVLKQASDIVYKKFIAVFSGPPVVKAAEAPTINDDPSPPGTSSKKSRTYKKPVVQKTMTEEQWKEYTKDWPDVSYFHACPFI